MLISLWLKLFSTFAKQNILCHSKPDRVVELQHCYCSQPVSTMYHQQVISHHAFNSSVNGEQQRHMTENCS